MVTMRKYVHFVLTIRFLSKVCFYKNNKETLESSFFLQTSVT